MGMFDFLKPKAGGGDKLLIDLIDDNAQRIAETEGKSLAEATYLAICMVYDDLASRPNGAQGQQALMGLLAERYRDQFNDVMTYVAWSTGRIKLKPEYEAELIARHQ